LSSDAEILAGADTERVRPTCPGSLPLELAAMLLVGRGLLAARRTRAAALEAMNMKEADGARPGHYSLPVGGE
jgi:hypothetical protein